MSPFQEAEAIIQKIKQQQYSDLLAHDQLLLERKDQKVFLHFGEGGHTVSPLHLFPGHLLST